MDERRTLSLNVFLNTLEEGCKNERRYCFILGAGASKTSGIPTGEELAKQWHGEILEQCSKEEIKELKKRLAYSSISQISYVLLGLFFALVGGLVAGAVIQNETQAVTMAIWMLLGYFLLLAALFFCFGALLFFFVHEGRLLLPEEEPAARYNIQVIFKALANPPDFWRVVEQGVQSAAAEYGVNCEVTAPPMEKDVDRQIELVREAIAKHPDAIILAASDYERMVPVCKEVTDAGILLVTVDSDVNYDGRRCFVGTDNVAIEAMSSVVNRNSDIKTSTVTTTGAVEIINLLDSRELEGGYTGSINLVQALRGEEPVKSYTGVPVFQGFTEKYPRA
mgnify:CR=1 FL=1